MNKKNKKEIAHFANEALQNGLFWPAFFPDAASTVEDILTVENADLGRIFFERYLDLWQICFRIGYLLTERGTGVKPLN